MAIAAVLRVEWSPMSVGLWPSVSSPNSCACYHILASAVSAVNVKVLLPDRYVFMNVCWSVLGVSKRRVRISAPCCIGHMMRLVMQLRVMVLSFSPFFDLEMWCKWRRPDGCGGCSQWCPDGLWRTADLGLGVVLCGDPLWRWGIFMTLSRKRKPGSAVVPMSDRQGLTCEHEGVK